MKKIKVAICAMCLLCAGIMLSACGEKSFDVNNIIIGTTEFTYDGTNRIFEVSYEGNTDIDVTYSLDKEEFLSADQLQISEIGSYEIYYKMTADGYTEFVSEDPITMNINPIEVVIYIQNVYQVVNDELIVPDYIVTGEYPANEEFDVEFSIADLPSVGNQEAGNSYLISGSATKENYNISFVNAKYYLIDSSDTVITGQVFDENIDSILEDDKTYIFDSCTFNTAVNSMKRASLMFNNCTFNAGDIGSGEMKCLYLTSITDLTIDACTFNGETKANANSTDAYTIDINLYSTTCENILIKNNYFNTVSEDVNVPIAIKVRFGPTDNPTDISGSLGNISGEVRIEANTFNGDNNIYLGALPNVIEEESSVNSSTGDFLCVITSNYSYLSIYELYTSVGDGNLLPIILEVGEERTFGLNADM